MAMNWQVFRTRALTALVFVAVMMAGLLWNQWSFFVLFSIVHFGAWVEYQKIVSLFNPDYKQTTPFHRYAVMLGGWSGMLYFTNEALRLGPVILTEAGVWLGIGLMVALPVIMYLDRKHVFLKNILYSLIGLVYISLPLALLMDLRTHWNEEAYRLSMTVPLLIIFSIWINDTMAYVVGSFIGKTPLSPISPKKTWEGTIGGVVLTIAVIALLAYFTERISVVHAGVMAGLAAIVGTIGDLFESKLKRMAGIKDSGSIMPGHGGFLDRFDSLLFAVVVVWVYAIVVWG
jgi:phosphatidate cytidylyltransferase